MPRPGFPLKRFSVHRFQQIPEAPSEPEHPMDTPNDVTIDIPLGNEEHSQTGTQAEQGQKQSEQSHEQPPQHDHQEQRLDEKQQDHRKSDSFSFTRWQSAPEEADPSRLNNEKAHLVPDYDASSTGRRRRLVKQRKTTSTNSSYDDADPGYPRNTSRLASAYKALLNSSILTRYLIYITPLATLLAIPIIVCASTARDATIGGVSVYWFFAWLEVVWVSLWVCKLSAKGLPYVVQSVAGVMVSVAGRRFGLMVRALEIPVALVAWVGVALITFFPMMSYNPEQKRWDDAGPKSWEKSIKNILFGLFSCSLLFLTEKTLVLLISISYHREQFDARIKESKRDVHTLCVLYDASRTMFPMYCKEFADEDALICDSLLAVVAGSSSNYSLLRDANGVIKSVGRNVGRLGDKVIEGVGSVSQEITGKHVFNPNAAHSIVTQALERKKSCEALAKRIWMSFVIEGREALLAEDIAEVLGTGAGRADPEEADEAFHLLDRDANGDITLDEMILTICELGRARKALHHSLQDVDQAVQVLDNLLLTVAAIVGVLIFVSFVTASGFGTVIAAAATALFSLSFIFATTAQEVLGSCVFLFVKHSFDVGDRIDINNTGYTVDRISLLFTVLRNISDSRVTQVSNATLNTLFIDNITRATAMHEALTVSVAFDTTFAHVQSLREEMEFFVRDRDNCRDFAPDINVEIVGVGEETDRLVLKVGVKHKSNWADEMVRAGRRSRFMYAFVYALRKLGIRGPGSAVPGAFEDINGHGNGSAAPSIDDGDNKRASDSSSVRVRTSTQEQGQSTAHLMVPDTMTDPNSQSTTTSSSSTTPHKSSSLRRRSMAAPTQQPPRPPTVASTTDDGFGPEDYRTPATSPERNRQASLRYSTSNGARVRHSLTRGVSTGRRNRGSTMFSSSGFCFGGVLGNGGGGYQAYPGGASVGADGPVPPQYWPPALQPGQSQNQPGSVSPRYYSPEREREHEPAESQHQDHQYQAYVASEEEELGQELQPQPLQYHHEPRGELPSVMEDAEEHSQRDQDETISPALPPSPTSRSWKSKAGSDEQGIGKPKGPRSA